MNARKLDLRGYVPSTLRAVIGGTSYEARLILEGRLAMTPAQSATVRAAPCMKTWNGIPCLGSGPHDVHRNGARNVQWDDAASDRSVSA